MAVSNFSAVEGISRMQLPCWDSAPSAASVRACLHPMPGPCLPPGGAFYLNSNVQIRDIRDGTSNTMAIGEVSWLYHSQRCVCCPDSPLGGTVWAGVYQAYRSDHVLATTGEGVNDADGDGVSLGFSDFTKSGFWDVDDAIRPIYEEASEVLGREFKYPGDP